MREFTTVADRQCHEAYVMSSPMHNLQIRDRVFDRLRYLLRRLPFLAILPYRRAGMPAPRANSWAGEINKKAASQARLTALEDSSVGSGRIFVGFGFLFTSM
ncbi:uncharacterized protein RAG0_10980 [Rhynchosporium agropyri]|uniref:Uncharacterized protein n=1 Tax=Rhynchosporium agropyri TaxID=914238 RepID=A0A1E1L239_9HELO|nr:uncharacterized protein RAG0_10980 [Rhynchosporium agropyri]